MLQALIYIYIYTHTQCTQTQKMIMILMGKKLRGEQSRPTKKADCNIILELYVPIRLTNTSYIFRKRLVILYSYNKFGG